MGVKSKSLDADSIERDGWPSPVLAQHCGQVFSKPCVVEALA